MERKKIIVIVGATSAIAEQCARIWMKDPFIELTLIGRDVKKVERVAMDLRVRSSQSNIYIKQSNFLQPQAIQETVDSIAELGLIDVVLIAHGYLPEQDTCQADLFACHEALETNGISPVLFAEAFINYMIQKNHGTLALIGSVAGDRGRKSNYIYGAAKEMVARFAEGLQHRVAGTKVNVVLIKPGPTDTPMTANIKAASCRGLACVTDVAQNIINAIERRQTVAYTPKKWRGIMWIIRHMPNALFNKLDI